MNTIVSSQRPKGGKPARSVGRFELRRELGKGAQATVWLGYDARLDREVAVKVLSQGADEAAVSQYLHEARSVSRLSHPHIVPVYEADEHQGQPYLVFEYVNGPTLSEKARKSGGVLKPREAINLMLGVIDALQAAHAAGIVHRDLKPSNILVDASNRARVMDFGIAARVKKDGSTVDQYERLIVGTPGYMSPEAARGDPPSPSMDIFAVGMMLGELLAGRPLLRERDPYKAVHRIQNEDMALPTGLDPQVDEGLRAIIQRAIARDPAQRFATAAELHDALKKWATPPAETAAPLGEGGGKGVLDFLLRRMRQKSDFPSMSDSVARIQRVTSSDKESVGSLADEILKDVALTNKLLRMVNSAHYSAVAGQVSTVSRAIALVGFAGIRNMALSLVLLDKMQDKGHANQLKEEFLRSLMAGQLSSQLCEYAKDSEEAFIGSMFLGLGRLLTEYYFPEEAAHIRDLIRPVDGSAPVDEKTAAMRVLGITFEELGLGVAKHWKLPDAMQRIMRRPDGDPPTSKVADKTERMRWQAAAANDVADALLYTDPEEAPKKLKAISERYSKVLNIDVKDITQTAEVAREKLQEMATGMSLEISPQSQAARLLPPPPPPPAAEGGAQVDLVIGEGSGSNDKTMIVGQNTADALEPHKLQATAVMDVDLAVGGDAGTPAEPPKPPAADMLAAGIQDITNTMVENFKLNDVLRMILETMYRALGFQRIVFCLRDPKTETLTGRFGLGSDVDVVKAVFKVSLKPAPGTQPDLFTAVCLKGVDTMIADASAANIAQRLPAWYRQQIGAPAFLLLPLMMKNAPFALIYADMARPGGFSLDDKELSLVRTLRNQAVMAFRQASS